VGVEIGRGGRADVGVEVERGGRTSGIACISENGGINSNKTQAMPKARKAPTIKRRFLLVISIA